METGSTIPTFIPRFQMPLSNMNINRDKVFRLITSLDTNKAHGCDGISAAMIKICDQSVVEPFCSIFERCLETGVYPTQWKKANVIPVHKKGCKQNKCNYRPISLIPIFGKIFEKLLFDVIYDHLSKHELITPHQSGFRPGESTINQLLLITHNIYRAFDDTPSRETRAIFLDFSKAFDTVWHEGLIYKLKANGLSGNILKILQDYLTDRKQRVLLNGKSSNWDIISAGVLQGSVLGPLLFLIYINDIVHNVECDIKLFADDTSLFMTVRDVNKAALDLSRDLTKINLWAWQWKMKFNADKTEEVVFSCKREKSIHPILKLGDEIIFTKSEHKHLGLILDSKLNFKSHIREAIVKARRGIGLLKYLSKYVSREVLDQIYKLYVRTHLDYGDNIYHKHDPDKQLNFTEQLEQTQYKAALAVSGAWKGTNRSRLLEELGWETLYDRRRYRRLCHFFGLSKSKTPLYLYQEIPEHRTVNYDLRNTRYYESNLSRTIRFSNSYFSNILDEWNKLDKKVQESPSISVFKRNLLQIIRPIKNPVYNICDIQGVKMLTRLRVKFSPLNEHRFRHNFECLSPVCICGAAMEDTEHYLLHCPQFSTLRQTLLGQISDGGFDIADMSTTDLCTVVRTR